MYYMLKRLHSVTALQPSTLSFLMMITFLRPCLPSPCFFSDTASPFPKSCSLAVNSVWLMRNPCSISICPLPADDLKLVATLDVCSEILEEVVRQNEVHIRVPRKIVIPRVSVESGQYAFVLGLGKHIFGCESGLRVLGVIWVEGSCNLMQVPLCQNVLSSPSKLDSNEFC